MWPVMQASRRIAGNSGVGACKGSYLRAWKWKVKWWKPGTMSTKQSDWESWGTCNTFGYKVGRVTEKCAPFAIVCVQVLTILERQWGTLYNLLAQKQLQAYYAHTPISSVVFGTRKRPSSLEKTVFLFFF